MLSIFIINKNKTKKCEIDFKTQQRNLKSKVKLTKGRVRCHNYLLESSLTVLAQIPDPAVVTHTGAVDALP